MKHKFKCRPAEECYRDDPHYTKEIEVEDYGYVSVSLAEYAAAAFAEQHCHRKSEYYEFDVQVLTAKGWETFEITIVAEPVFSAKLRKGVPPEPVWPTCGSCGEPFAPGTTSIDCPKCEEEARLEREERVDE